MLAPHRVSAGPSRNLGGGAVRLWEVGYGFLPVLLRLVRVSVRSKGRCRGVVAPRPEDSRAVVKRPHVAAAGSFGGFGGVPSTSA